MIHIRALIDDPRCVETVRAMRGPDGVRRTACGTAAVTKDGRDETPPGRPCARCHGGRTRSDDRTDPLLAGHHQPPRARVLGLDLRGLSRANGQGAREVESDPGGARVMTPQPRGGIVGRPPEVQHSGGVERGAADGVAGHKGQPEAVRRTGGPGAADG